MKTIRKPNPVKMRILGYQHPEPGMKYVYNPCLIREGNAVYNPLTEEAVIIEDEAADKTQMVKRWYLVPEETDIKSMSHMVRQILLTAATVPGLAKTGYTIFSTTGCNACCEYCFEKDFDVIVMSDQVARDVGAYIVKTRSKKEPIVVRYFGGEPLCNKAAITTICGILTENGVNFSSEITTNGDLLPGCSDEEFRAWHLTKVQLTADDVGTEYDRIKGLPAGAYERMHASIDRLDALGIKVSVRVHLDPEKGTDPCYRVINDMLQHPHVSMYARMLYGDNTEDDFRDLLGVEQYMIDHGRMSNAFPRYASGTHCMADRQTYATIGPKGDLSPCEHFAYGPEMYGNIYTIHKRGDVLARWKERVKHTDAYCNTCPLYPMCEKICACTSEGTCEQGYRWYLIERIKRVLKGGIKT